MINEVRNAVMFILNKDNNGYLSPAEFNSFAALAQMEVFQELFQDTNNAYTKRNNRTANSGVADIAKKDSQDLDRFVVPGASLVLDSGSTFTLPADMYVLVDVIYGGKSVERVSPHKITLLNNSNLTAPSTFYPAYVDAEAKIILYPTSIVSDVTATYVRLPVDPKWTYFTDPSTTSPLFDPSANDYQDFELGKEHEIDLVLRILAKAGVTLRESSIIEVVNMEENKKDQANR